MATFEVGLGLVAVGAGLAVGGAGIGTGIGQGRATAGALEAMARNPEMAKEIKSTMLLGCGIAESAAIYGLLISGALVFVLFSHLPA